MRSLFFIFLPIFIQAQTIDYRLLNDGANNLDVDSVIDLGTITTSSNFCSDPGLSSMSSIGQNSQNATCSVYNQSGQRGINLSIPLRSVINSDTEISVTFRSSTSSNNFQVFELRDIRNQSIGGGNIIWNQPILMNSTDSYDYELDIRAIIFGSQAKSQYDQSILIDITIP